MDFSYYDNKGKKVRLDISVGQNWSELNIQNKRLNSVFEQINDNNDEISETEFSLLKRLFNKADKLIYGTAENKILENEELDEVLMQIDNGETILPSAVPRESVVHDGYGLLKLEDWKDLNNPETVDNVIEKYKEKIKNDLKRYHRYDERFPEDKYEIEVVYNGRYFVSSVYDKVSGAKYQCINDFNGIIDINDFTKEDLEKLENSYLLSILNIDRAQGRMWTTGLSQIVASILNNVDLDEKTINVKIDHWEGNRDLVYDVETKTLKIIDNNSSGCHNFRKIQFDKNGFVIEDSSCSMLTTYKKDGKRYELGIPFINYLAEKEGFSISSNKELSEEQIKLYQELSEGIEIWDKHQYKRDDNGNIIGSKEYMRDAIIESTRADGVEESTVTDKMGNIISRSKSFRKEEGNTITSVKEELDEQGNLICRTKKIATIYDEPMILNKKGSTYTERQSETKTIKEFSDGRIEENTEFDEWETNDLNVNDTYEDTNFIREDGTKFEIKYKNGSASVIDITTPNGKTFSMDCEGYKYGNTYYENQLPTLNDVLNSIPTKVLEDISNEISDIKLSDKIQENAHYVFDTNTFVYNTKIKQGTMSFVHEIGHAIDNQNGNMWSKKSKFSNKFAKMKELADKLINHENNHALDCAEEYFASAYANMEYPDGNNNHIGMLDKLILPFKDSQKPEEKELYELHMSLKNDVKNRIEEVRKQPKNIRMDNSVTNIVKTELKDIIEILNKDNFSVCIALQIADVGSLELEIISTLVGNVDIFNNAIELYEKCSKNEVINEFDVRLDISEESQQAFKELIPKLKEIRARLKK